jgi:hypothetical protein
MSDQFEPLPKPDDYVGNAPDTDALEGVLEAFPEVIKESKAGYKTTEFWVTIAGSAAALLGAVPEKYQPIVLAVLGGAYAISRGLAKKGVPHIEVEEA